MVSTWLLTILSCVFFSLAALSLLALILHTSERIIDGTALFGATSMVLVLCLCAGCAATFFWTSGPAILSIATVIGASLTACICRSAGSILFGYPLFRAGKLGLMICGIGLSVLPAGEILLTLPARAAYLREQAPFVKQFGLEYFEALDANSDGNLSEEELKYALSTIQLSEKERQLLQLMIREYQEIGHSIYLGWGTDDTAHYRHELNRTDLNGYPDWLAREYRNW